MHQKGVGTLFVRGSISVVSLAGTADDLGKIFYLAPQIKKTCSRFILLRSFGQIEMRLRILLALQGVA